MNDVFIELLNHLDKSDLVHIIQLNKETRQYLIKQSIWSIRLRDANEEFVKLALQKTDYETYCKYTSIEGKLTRWKKALKFKGTIKELYNCYNYTNKGPYHITIPKDLYLPNLESLTLTGCSIKSIPKTICLPRLCWLDLSFNKIRSIPDNIDLNALYFIFLDSNPLDSRFKDKLDRLPNHEKEGQSYEHRYNKVVFDEDG